MNHQQYLATLAIDAAGQLRRAGCQVLAVTSVNGPWLKARMPERISAATRRHLLAAAWQCHATVEWRTR